MSEKVTVKPDERGGYTVEKFGASTYFSAEQWENLLAAVKESDKNGEAASANIAFEKAEKEGKKEADQTVADEKVEDKLTDDPTVQGATTGPPKKSTSK